MTHITPRVREAFGAVTRTETTSQKVKTNFGSMYIHIERDVHGRPVGGNISTPGKEPESQIHILIETLSDGLNKALGGE